MKRKRILAIILTLTLAFSMAACGEKKEEAADTKTEEAAAEEEAPAEEEKKEEAEEAPAEEEKKEEAAEEEAPAEEEKKEEAEEAPAEEKTEEAAEEEAPAEEAEAADSKGEESASQAGTAGSPKQDIADSEGSGAAEGDLKPVKMGLAMQSLQAAAFHAWADYLEYRLDYEAEQRGYDVELIVTNADNDVTKQANDIRDLISAGCEVIFCPCLDSQAILQSVKEVHDAGIIYVSYCREVSHDAKGDQVPDLTVNFASEEQAYAGMMDLWEIMKADGVEPVKLIDCYGDKTDENAHNREDGLRRAMEEGGYADLPVVEVECGHWEPDVCGDNLAPVLAANPDANCMYSSSDFLNSGIQKAMEDADMWHKRGEEGHVYFSASDMYPLGIQHLREGYMDTAVDQGCYNFAVHAAEGAFDLLEGKDVDPVQLVLGTQATNDNIEEILKTTPLWGNDYADY